MTKNLIPVIAEKLGVEIGEEFDVNIPYMGTTRWCRYKLTNKGLVRKRETGEWWSSPGFLERLICGDYEISKLPYKPKYSEEYWTYTGGAWNVADALWEDRAIDCVRKHCGCVFRTKEEAIAARPAKYQTLTGKEWKDG